MNKTNEVFLVYLWLIAFTIQFYAVLFGILFVLYKILNVLTFTCLIVSAFVVIALTILNRYLKTKKENNNGTIYL